MGRTPYYPPHRPPKRNTQLEMYENQNRVEEGRKTLSCCLEIVSCCQNYSKAAVAWGITAITASALASNSSQLTKDSGASSALYGTCVPIAMISSVSCLYNLYKFCCNTDVTQATASNTTSQKISTV